VRTAGMRKARRRETEREGEVLLYPALPEKHPEE
jgi:hypothetical protein